MFVSVSVTKFHMGLFLSILVNNKSQSQLSQIVFDSDNSLAPIRYQAIAWTNDDQIRRWMMTQFIDAYIHP